MAFLYGLIYMSIYKINTLVGRINLTILLKCLSIIISIVSYFTYNDVIKFIFMMVIGMNYFNEVVFGFVFIMDLLEPSVLP